MDENALIEAGFGKRGPAGTLYLAYQGRLFVALPLRSPHPDHAAALQLAFYADAKAYARRECSRNVPFTSAAQAVDFLRTFCGIPKPVC